MTDEMKSIDRAMYVFMKQEQIAKNMLLDGEPVERVARLTEVPLYMVRKLKEEMELAEVQLSLLPEPGILGSAHLWRLLHSRE